MPLEFNDVLGSDDAQKVYSFWHENNFDSYTYVDFLDARSCQFANLIVQIGCK